MGLQGYGAGRVLALPGAVGEWTLLLRPAERACHPRAVDQVLGAVTGRALQGEFLPGALTFRLQLVSASLPLKLHRALGSLKAGRAVIWVASRCITSRVVSQVCLACGQVSGCPWLRDWHLEVA